MTFRIEPQIITEKVPINNEKNQKMDMLKIKVHTDFPNAPLEIKLDESSAFKTQTDDNGVSECSTSLIQDYHIIVNIADNTFEEDIKIDEI
ncbi:hypothetical protein [Methanobrevibacter sp.]|uniref:hypothetical protein n=1 Tax=Methanobrevibacter sp. TaxID=66852 RepID=UPI0025F9F78D|nr:hypothetical protein [Methanobrevibacter sp.]MBQ2832895.1 hypothetical protein [Methanobrevibacter sp.]